MKSYALPYTEAEGFITPSVFEHLIRYVGGLDSLFSNILKGNHSCNTVQQTPEGVLYSMQNTHVNFGRIVPSAMWVFCSMYTDYLQQLLSASNEKIVSVTLTNDKFIIGVL